MTSLRILGPVEVWEGDRRLSLGGPRQLRLLAVLVLHANRAVSRDSLIDAVWGPERSNVGNRLQMAIARLRKALEPPNADSGQRLQTVSGGYLLAVAPGELDSDRFYSGVHAGIRALERDEPAQARQLLTGALSLWRGPPLAEVAFEDFAQAEIRRLEELRMRALECRIDAELSLGHDAEVIGELEGLLAGAPTREHLAGQLMLALYRCGRQADALDVYQRMRAELAQEVGLEPGPALKGLQVEILQQAPSLGPVGDDRPPPRAVHARGVKAPLPVRMRPYGPSVFAGRRRERESLARSLSELTRTGRHAVFVTGEAGIGKTRLVSEFARDAHDRGTLVLAGRCDDDLSLPYQPFVEAMEHLVAHAPPPLLERHVAEYGDSVARLVPGLEPFARPKDPMTDLGSSESEPYVLFRAIEGLLSAACDGGSLLLALEDLHWADVPTVKLLRRLLTSSRDWPLLVVCTARLDGLAEDHPLRSLVAAVHREPHVLRLDLSGLQGADVAELLRGMGEEVTGTVDRGLTDAVESNTNGNPFFITELVRTLAEVGALVDERGRLTLKEGIEVAAQLPLSIAETLAQRLRRLPEEVRRCLEVAAVVGEEFELGLVAEVAGIPTVGEAIARAVEGAVAVDVPGRPGCFRFAHTLMQRYLYRELGGAQQTQLHREIALALERRGVRGGGAAELATHWIAALDMDVAAALGYSIQAGDEALAKLAPDEARRWYDRSLRLINRGPGAREAQRCELMIKRGEAERQAGDRRFRETLLEAAELAHRIGDNANLVRAALGNTRGMQSATGIVDEARMAMLDSGLRIVGDAPSPERARLLAMQAAELMYSREWERRVRLSDQALGLARSLDDPDALSAVLNMRFVSLLAPETLEERLENTIEALAVAERLTDPLVRFYAYHWRAYACIESGDILAARSWAAREQDIADRFRQPTTLWLRRADEANLAIIAGDLELADERSAAALEIGRHSEPDAAACYAAQQTSIAFERHMLGEIVPLLERAVHDNPGVPGFRATLALAFVEAARPEDARNLLEQAVAWGFRDIPYDITWLTVACIYAYVCSKLEELTAASLLYGMLEPWGDQIAFPAFGVWGPVSLYLGGLARVLGESEAANRHLLSAARAAIRAGAPIWEAHATSQLGLLAEMAR
jgi:DNA-binding SARP family transcriptional activator